MVYLSYTFSMGYTPVILYDLLGVILHPDYLQSSLMRWHTHKGYTEQKLLEGPQWNAADHTFAPITGWQTKLADFIPVDTGIHLVFHLCKLHIPHDTETLQEASHVDEDFSFKFKGYYTNPADFYLMQSVNCMNSSPWDRFVYPKSKQTVQIGVSISQAQVHCRNSKYLEPG